MPIASPCVSQMAAIPRAHYVVPLALSPILASAWRFLHRADTNAARWPCWAERSHAQKMPLTQLPLTPVHASSAAPTVKASGLPAATAVATLGFPATAGPAPATAGASAPPVAAVGTRAPGATHVPPAGRGSPSHAICAHSCVSALTIQLREVVATMHAPSAGGAVVARDARKGSCLSATTKTEQEAGGERGTAGPAWPLTGLAPAVGRWVNQALLAGRVFAEVMPPAYAQPFACSMRARQSPRR